MGSEICIGEDGSCSGEREGDGSVNGRERSRCQSLGRTVEVVEGSDGYDSTDSAWKLSAWVRYKTEEQEM